MELRPLTDADLDRVVELEEAVFSDAWRREYFVTAMRRPRSICLVAEDAGVVAGYVIAGVERDAVHVVNLAVAPGARERGIGRRMMVAVEEFARSVGCRLLVLEVRRSNSPARLFYARMGFAPVAVHRGYYVDNGEDAILMERVVEPAGPEH